MPDPLVHARDSEAHSQAPRRVLLVFPRYSPSFGTFESAFHILASNYCLLPLGLPGHDAAFHDV